MRTHEYEPRQLVMIDYTNYQGIRGKRRIVPGVIVFTAKPPWHPDPQWLMEAWDIDKGAWRTFAVKDIHSWEPADDR